MNEEPLHFDVMSDPYQDGLAHPVVCRSCNVVAAWIPLIHTDKPDKIWRSVRKHIRERHGYCCDDPQWYHYVSKDVKTQADHDQKTANPATKIPRA